MDLVTLDRKDYSVKGLVEDWSTLIWTERYQPAGDFELHTYAIGSTRQILPEGRLCSLRDTNEVAMVDYHFIQTDEDGVEELVVKGHTVDLFPSNRVWTNAPYNKKIAMAKKYSTRQAAEVWLWNAICNGTGNDRIKTSASYPAGNQLPNVIVTDSVPPSSDGPNKARKVQNGNVYDQLMTFLASGQLGIRIIRPNGTSGRKVSVAGDGEFSTDHVDDIEDLRFDIYKGRDISDRVVFSYKAGHLDSPSYLWSRETMKTGAFVDGDPRDHYYTDPDAVPGTNAGWNRLDTYVDGGSKEDLTQGGSESDADFAARKAAAADDFEESLEDQGLRAVRKEGKHIESLDASINPFAGFKYGRDYRLGDHVMVQGKYGQHAKKWVTEFIRTQDANGEYGYPTLSSTLS